MVIEPGISTTQQKRFLPIVIKMPGETDEESISRYGCDPCKGGYVIKETNRQFHIYYRPPAKGAGVPLIIGDGLFPEAAAFYDARDALDGFGDVVLNANRAHEIGQDIPSGSIIYNLEHIVPAVNQIVRLKRDIVLIDLLRTGKFTVWDYQRSNVEYLRSQGIKAQHVPFGYHPCFERAPLVAQQDIDILFFGTSTPRRDRVLTEIARAGIQHKYIFNGSSVYGRERDELVSRAKIIVNLHRIEGHPLEVVRLNYLLANKCFVVSECGIDEAETAIYDDGLVFANYRDIAKTCLAYLDKDRETIAARGREIIRARPMSSMLTP